MRHLWLARLVGVVAAPVCCAALAVPVAEASFPGRNGRIAYQGEQAGPTPFAPIRGVYSVRPDGTGRRLILRNEPYPPDLFTPVSARYSLPEYAPGGARIAFVRSTASALGPDRLVDSIWVARSDGSQRRELINAGPYGTVTSPAWAPDGRALVFFRDPCGAYHTGDELVCPPEVSRPSDYGLFIYRRGQIRLLTHKKGNAPAWSPNGRLIAYVSQDEALAEAGAVYVIRPDGSGRRRIFNKGYVYSVDWSPCGCRLVIDYTTSRGRGVASIRPDGTGYRLLTRDGEQPAYSPDGRKIVFTRGAEFLMTMRADGSRQRRIRLPSGQPIKFPHSPAWQPLPPFQTHTVCGSAASRKLC